LEVAMILITFWLLGLSPLPQTVGTRCAACHLANLPGIVGAEHLGEWQRSAHAKKGVGCHECHGGDPWTYEPRDAHRGVVGASSAASPVNRVNLVRTCARCHERNALAFATTLHGTLAQLDDRRAPTCVTCHGVMSARVPAPETLAAKCAGCHPSGTPRGDYPDVMRAALEALNAQRTRADTLQDAIERTADAHDRVARLVALYDTRRILNEAIAAVHRIDPQIVVEQTKAAAARLDALDVVVTNDR